MLKILDFMFTNSNMTGHIKSIHNENVREVKFNRSVVYSASINGDIVILDNWNIKTAETQYDLSDMINNGSHRKIINKIGTITKILIIPFTILALMPLFLD